MSSVYGNNVMFYKKKTVLNDVDEKISSISHGTLYIRVD
jgi:hypothetical protein